MNQIPAKCLRVDSEVLALLLRYIINLSIKLSTFPQKCKIVILKTIFKGARTGPKNYRPVSFLPLVSEITEKAIHYQLKTTLIRKANLHVSLRLQNESQTFVWLN